MPTPLIKSVGHLPRVQDALKKSDPEKKEKARRAPPKSKKKNDPKRIIDTYA